MITTLLDEPEDHTVQRCIALINKHGPRLMREGGGALTQEAPACGRRMRPVERTRIVRLRERGVPLNEIARMTGWSATMVGKVCRRAGFVSRRAVFRLNEGQVAKIFEMRSRGCTQREIARAVGCSETAVNKRLRGKWTVRKAA